jgi:DNA-binding transcriptional LysR family regulator
VAAVADALQFTPSAVSQQLAVLEREAGVPLLEKAGRGLRLTDPALVLVAHAEALLERAARAVADLAAGEQEGLLPGGVGGGGHGGTSC